MTENEVQEAPMTTYALWGTGDITAENAKALLEEYIPDNVGTVFRPDRITRDHKGLRTALDWFESPDFLGDGGALPSTDLIQSLVDERDGTFHDEVFLLTLWPNEPSHEDFDFIESVQQSGITVIALSHAFVELDLSLYSRPEATKEEKAEARAAAAAEKKPRGRPRKLSDAAPKEEFPSPATQAAGQKMVTQTEPLNCEGLLPDVQVNDDLTAQMFEGIKRYIDARVDAGIKAAMQSLGEAVRPVLRHDEHPFERPYIGIDTKPYFFNKTTNVYREGTGKPRRGELLVNMTDEEAQEKGAL
jgi:hypothetical protein